MQCWTVLLLLLVLLVHYAAPAKKNPVQRCKRTNHWYCSDPGTPSNGYRQQPYQRQFSVGSSILYRCNAGYLPQGSPVLTCSYDQDKMMAAWNRDPPQCIEAEGCPDFGVIAHGVRVLNGTRSGDVVTFRCNDGYDLLGFRQLMCGEDQLWEGVWPRCMKGFVQCGDPGTPLHGNRTVHGTRDGRTVMYTCEKGYSLQGGAYRTCSPSGEWSGELPLCARVICEPPQDTTHGTVLYNSTVFGSVATYSCEEGYFVMGYAISVCGHGARWSSLPPSCNIVECALLRSPTNGRVKQGRQPMFGAMANYTCRRGYGLMGVSARTCQADGTWSDSAPSCHRGSCGTLTNPENGMVRWNSILFEGHAFYWCNQGYILSGYFVRVCGILGTWSGEPPACNAVECANLHSPLHGAVSTSDSNKYLPIANYSCNYGYKLIGSETRECQYTGSWSGRAPGCFAIRCKWLVSPHNGGVQYNSTILGSEAHYYCNSDHELLFGDTIRSCLPGGVWSGSAPCCTRKEIVCPNLTAPDNGSVEFISRVGEQASYSCAPGLVVVGEGVRLCQANGEWSGDAPLCGVPCQDLEDPANGGVVQNGSDPGSMAYYTCADGFMPSSKEACRTCSIDGVWLGAEITCKNENVTSGVGVTVSIPRDCDPLLDPENGMVDFGRGGDIFIGTQANYSCNAGYQLVGQRSRSCGIDGNWSGSEPQCTRITCEMLTPPPNTVITFSADNFLNSTAEYACTSGYLFVGGQVRTCTISGWTGSEPVCQEILCPDLPDPLGGMVSLTSRTIGSIVTYSCSEGFTLSGSAERVCQENGTWSITPPPFCSPITCPALPNPEGGMVELQGTSPGDEAVYSCSNNTLALVGQDSRVCGEDGEWEREAPICEEILCPDLPDPLGGVVNLTSRTIGSIVTYSCSEGFTLNGSAERVCQENGTWSITPPPSCSRVTCPALPNPDGGVVELQGTLPGDEAVYSCSNNTLALVGQDSRVCGEDGEWEGEAPICEVILCPVLTDPANGVVDVTERTVGSQAIYTCDDGFAANGLIVRTCSGSGQWTGEETQCIDRTTITCPQLPDPVNGGVITMNSLSGRAIYSCDVDFFPVGLIVRTCMVNGEWSGTAPTCQPNINTLSCPLLTAPENGFIDIDSTRVGAKVTYTCREGYMLEGSSERECLDNGTSVAWTGTLATCNPVDCGTLEDPVNGMVDATRGTTLGNVATYECDVGYMRVGQLLRVCQTSGLWNGLAPTCILIDCGPLSNPADGAVDTSEGTLLDDVALYTCSLGHRLNGESSRTCGATGIWSGATPTCEVVTCPVLTAPDNGGLLLTNGNISGSRAIYSCDAGFSLSPSNSVFSECLQNGAWSNSEPLCIVVARATRAAGAAGAAGAAKAAAVVVAARAARAAAVVGCPDPGFPTNGRRVQINDFAVGSRMYFVPRDGFESQEPSVIKCQGNGSWTSSPPHFSASSMSKCSSDGEIDEFGRTCGDCSSNKQNHGCCRYRRGWSALSEQEKQRYIAAVLKVSSDPAYKPLYQSLIARYHTSFATSAQSTVPETSQFIPWHRYFLMEYEDLLRLVDRTITIPYWDWSVATSRPYTSPVFLGTGAPGFGGSADPDTGCVSTGPFSAGGFEVTRPNGSVGCLTRMYGDFESFGRDLLEESLSRGVFAEVHNFVQLFLTANIRCFVGGEMCSPNAASDPLFLLHLARVDLFVQNWQERDKNNTIVRKSGKRDRLGHTLAPSLTVGDFSSNDALPYDVCVRYAPSSAGRSSDMGGGGRTRCVAESRFKDGGVALSEQAKAYLDRKCDKT